MTIAAWLHDLNPFVVRIAGDFGIRWYGLSYVLGFAIAYFAIRFLARRGATLLPADRAMDVVLYGALGAFVGGRVGYAVVYQPSLLVEFTPSFPFWGMLALNRGGMASHGGMVGVLVAGWIVSRGFKAEDGSRIGASPMLHVLDVFALAAPFGLFLGRVANFVNGELLGRVVAQPGESAPWWAVRFPQELRPEEAQGIEYTPTQLLEIDLLVGEQMLPGQDYELGIENLIIAVQSGAADIAQRVEPLLSARHPSQLYQAVAEGVVVAAVVWFIARKRRTPGVISAAFLLTYGLLRIATEFVRLPDPQLAVQRPLGLSRGQWLSVVMVALGLVLAVLCKRRGAKPIGGWAERGDKNEPASG
ncbi:MAG: prolipoprotein diacylglyceryl transferase [Planctomycetota bacterium]